MLSVTTLLCVVCLFTLITWWSKKKKSKYPLAPVYPGALPIIGNAYMMIGDSVHIWEIMKILSDYSVKVGGVLRFFAGPKTLYVISDPDDVSTVLSKCLEKAFLYKYAQTWAGNGLVASDVSLWKKNRKLLAPYFNQRSVNMFLDIYNSKSRELVNQLEAEVGKGKFDHYPHLLKMMLKIVNETILGVVQEDSSINTTYMHDTDDLLDLYLERLQKIWLQIPYFYERSDLKRRQDTILNKIKERTAGVIRKRKLELMNAKNETVDQTSDSKMRTLLESIILQSLADDEGFTDEEIREHLETFMIAAFDTTGRTIIFALNLIGAFPNVQEKIYKEIKDVFGDSDRDVNKEDILKLTYLEAAIKESLRVNPITPYIGRTVDVDLQLKNFIIPAGETALCSIYGVNRHHTWGGDATEFRPERWLDEKMPPSALFGSFSIGKRNCIGEMYAMTTMKTVMVHLFRRFKVSGDHTNMVIKYHACIKPLAGHHISLELRS